MKHRFLKIWKYIWARKRRAVLTEKMIKRIEVLRQEHVNGLLELNKSMKVVNSDYFKRKKNAWSMHKMDLIDSVEAKLEKYGSKV